MKPKPPFDTKDKRNDATCAGESGPKTKKRAADMRRPPFTARNTDMNNITYHQYPNSAARWGIGVFFNSKLTGYIERTIIGELNSDSENPTPVYGYYYNPNGGWPQDIGKQFATIEEVKESLEN